MTGGQKDTILPVPVRFIRTLSAWRLLVFLAFIFQPVQAKAVKGYPQEARAHFERANEYARDYDRFKASDPEQARRSLSQSAAELEQAISLEPDFLPAHYNLGVVLKRQGKFEEARERFRKVLSGDPQQAGAHMQIGATYEEQGFYDDARENYLKAREVDFGNSSIEAAILDLERHEDEAHQKMLHGRALSLNRLQRYTDASLRGHPYLSQATTQSGQGAGEAIAYLSAWLIQEFMKAKGNGE